MNVYSGECRLCAVGTPTGAKDSAGKELHTGDIVQVWHGDGVGTDLEQWHPAGGLTVVVSDQFQSFSDGSVIEKSDPVPFIMGIKDCGFNHPEWRINLLKKYSDVIDGERWPEYGFRYASEFDAAIDRMRSEDGKGGKL